MQNVGFTKKDTLMAKGIFVCFLLWHHLFIYDTAAEMNLNTITSNTLFISNLATYGKICLGGFTFISAYGITCKLQNVDMDRLSIRGIWARRISTLWSNSIFVWIMALLWKKIIIGEPILDLYKDLQGKTRWISLILEAIGLGDFFSTPYMGKPWWYLKFAFLLILAMPAIYWIYKRCGMAFYFLAILAFQDELIAAAILGVAFAEEKWFEKWLVYISDSKWKKILNILCISIVLYASYEIVAISGVEYGIRSFIGCVWIWFVISVIRYIPVLSQILSIIGKNATNIFLIHAFLYTNFYKDFIYSFNNIIFIFGALLIISVLVSEIFELIKKVIHYDNISKWIIEILSSKNIIK